MTRACTQGASVSAMRSTRSDSVASLVSSMRGIFCRYASPSPDAVGMLVAFSLASWFADCLPLAPILDLVGPESDVSLVLRLLGCTCRRALLLGDVDIAALATLPTQLGPTLLVNQRGLGRGITRVLQASSDRHFRVARGARALDLYGTKAFSADAGSMAGPGVEVCIFHLPQPPSAAADASSGGRNRRRSPSEAVALPHGISPLRARCEGGLRELSPDAVAKGSTHG